MQTDTATPEMVNSPIVLLGRDNQGKAHASRFEAAEAPLAEKAAGLMGMQVLRIVSEEVATLAATLPRGRIFASGRGFVPFVKAELFAKLEATPGAFTPARHADDAPQAPNKPKGGRRAAAGSETVSEPPEAADGPGMPAVDLAGLKVGSIALAAEEGEPPAVFYAVSVVAERGPDLLELRWLEYPELPLIVRRREHLGLFPPALAGELA